jgi:hypothetical protein
MTNDSTKVDITQPVVLIIFGSRRLRNYRFVRQSLDRLLQNVHQQIVVVRSGHAKGADQLGERYAREVLRIEPEIYEALWNAITDDAVIRIRDDGSRYNHAAGVQRNEQMIIGRDERKATHAIAFKPDYCESKGTDDMTERCRRHGVLLKIVKFSELHGG